MDELPAPNDPSDGAAPPAAPSAWAPPPDVQRVAPPPEAWTPSHPPAHPGPPPGASPVVAPPPFNPPAPLRPPVPFNPPGATLFATPPSSAPPGPALSLAHLPPPPSPGDAGVPPAWGQGSSSAITPIPSSAFVDDRPERASRVDYDGYGGIWARLLALILDGMIWFPVQTLIVVLVDSELLGGGDRSVFGAANGGWSGFWSSMGGFTFNLGYLAYRVVTEATGGTFGKRLLRLRTLRHSDGRSLGFGRALFRETIGRFCAGFVCFYGYLSAFWEPEARGWHDKLAGSMVVHLTPEG